MNEQKSLVNHTERPRLQWVDILKGMAMLLVIVGHTAPFGSFTRNMIFSFHMPIFFILSGFCSHRVSSRNELRNFLFKHFVKLIIPVILLSLITMGMDFIQSELDMSQIHEIVRTEINKLTWSSGVKFKNHPGLDMPWFLISLFTASAIFQYLSFKIKEENSKETEYGISDAKSDRKGT